MATKPKMTYNQTKKFIDLLIDNVVTDDTFLEDLLSNGDEHKLIIYFDNGQKLEIRTVIAILVRVISGLYGEEHGKRGRTIYGRHGQSGTIAIEYRENGLYLGYNNGTLL